MYFGNFGSLKLKIDYLLIIVMPGNDYDSVLHIFVIVPLKPLVFCPVYINKNKLHKRVYAYVKTRPVADPDGIQGVRSNPLPVHCF